MVVRQTEVLNSNTEYDQLMGLRPFYRIIQINIDSRNVSNVVSKLSLELEGSLYLFKHFIFSSVESILSPERPTGVAGAAEEDVVDDQGQVRSALSSHMYSAV